MLALLQNVPDAASSPGDLESPKTPSTTSPEQLSRSASNLSVRKLGEGGSWVDSGQAKALNRAQARLFRLLERCVDNGKQEAFRGEVRSDCHEALSRHLPGARVWPLSDKLVSRVLTFNIAHERFTSASSCIRLDRGTRFLDLVRVHYGEEVAFLFAWQSHYIYMMAWFVLMAVPFILLRTAQGKGHIDKSLLPHSALTILFGVAVTEFWELRVSRLVRRWHAHGDAESRWSLLTERLLEKQMKRQATWTSFARLL